MPEKAATTDHGKNYRVELTNTPLACCDFFSLQLYELYRKCGTHACKVIHSKEKEGSLLTSIYCAKATIYSRTSTDY